jgi:hypothetical protein
MVRAFQLPQLERADSVEEPDDMNGMRAMWQDAMRSWRYEAVAVKSKSPFHQSFGIRSLSEVEAHIFNWREEEYL